MERKEVVIQEELIKNWGLTETQATRLFELLDRAGGTDALLNAIRE